MKKKTNDKKYVKSIRMWKSLPITKFEKVYYMKQQTNIKKFTNVRNNTNVKKYADNEKNANLKKVYKQDLYTLKVYKYFGEYINVL